MGQVGIIVVTAKLVKENGQAIEAGLVTIVGYNVHYIVIFLSIYIYLFFFFTKQVMFLPMHFDLLSIRFANFAQNCK